MDTDNSAVKDWGGGRGVEGSQLGKQGAICNTLKIKIKFLKSKNRYMSNLRISV